MNSQILQTSIKFSIKTNNLNQIHKKIDKSPKISISKTSPKVTHLNESFTNAGLKKDIDLSISTQSSDSSAFSGIPVIKKINSSKDVIKRDVVLKRSLDEKADESVPKLRKYDDSKDTVIIEPETSSKLVIHPLPKYDKSINDYSIKNEISMQSKDIKENSINAIFKKLEEKINNIDKICKINPLNQLNNSKSDIKNDSSRIIKEKPVSQFSNFSLKMQPKKNIVDNIGIFADDNEVEEHKTVKMNNISSKLKEERLKSFQETLREEYTEKNKFLLKENSITKKAKADSREQIVHNKSNERHETHRKTKCSKDKYKDNYYGDDDHRKSRRKSREKSSPRTKSDQKSIAIPVKKPIEISIIPKPISPNSISEQVLEESFNISAVSSSISFRNKSKFSENIKRLLSKNQDLSHENSSNTDHNSSQISSPQSTISQPSSFNNTVDHSCVKTEQVTGNLEKHPLKHETSDSEQHIPSETSAASLILPVAKPTEVSEVSVLAQEPLHKPSNIFMKTSNISFKFAPKRMPASNIFSDLVDEKSISSRNPATNQFPTGVKETVIVSPESCLPYNKIDPVDPIISSNEEVMPSIDREPVIALSSQSDTVPVTIEPSICPKIPHSNSNRKNKQDSNMTETIDRGHVSMPIRRCIRELPRNLFTDPSTASSNEPGTGIRRFCVTKVVNCLVSMDTVTSSDEMSNSEPSVKTESVIDQSPISAPKLTSVIPDITMATKTKDINKNYQLSVPKIESEIVPALSSYVCKTEPVVMDTEKCVIEEINKSLDGVKEEREKDKTDWVMATTFKVPLSTKKQKTDKKSSGDVTDHDRNHDNNQHGLININMEVDVMQQHSCDAVECPVSVTTEQQSLCQQPSIDLITIGNGDTEVKQHPSSAANNLTLTWKQKFQSKRFRKTERSSSNDRSRSKEPLPDIVVEQPEQIRNDDNFEKLSEKISHQQREDCVSQCRKSPKNFQKSSLINFTDRSSDHKLSLHQTTEKHSKERSRSKDRNKHLTDQGKSVKHLKDHEKTTKHSKDQAKLIKHSKDLEEIKKQSKNHEESKKHSKDQEKITKNLKDQEKSINHSKDQEKSINHSKDQEKSINHSKDQGGSGKQLNDKEGSGKNTIDLEGYRKHSKDQEESRKHSNDKPRSRKYSRDKQRLRKHSKDKKESGKQSRDMQISRKNSRDKKESRRHSKDKQGSRKHSKDKQGSRMHSRDKQGSRMHSRDKQGSRMHSRDKEESRRHWKDQPRFGKHSKDQSEIRKQSKIHSRSRKKSRNRSKTKEHSTEHMRTWKHSKARSRSIKDTNDRSRHSLTKKNSKDRSRPIKQYKDRSQSRKRSKDRWRSGKSLKDRLKYRSDQRKSFGTVSSVKKSITKAEQSRDDHQDGRQSPDIAKPTRYLKTRTNSSNSSTHSESRSSSSSSTGSSSSSTSSTSSSTSTSSNGTVRSATAIIDSLSAKTRAIVPRDCLRLPRATVTMVPQTTMVVAPSCTSIEEPLIRTPVTMVDFRDIVMPDSGQLNSLDNRADTCCTPQTEQAMPKSRPQSPMDTGQLLVTHQDTVGQPPVSGDTRHTGNMLLDQLVSIGGKTEATHKEIELADLITRLITRAVSASLDDSAGHGLSAHQPPNPADSSYSSQPQLYMPYSSYNSLLYQPPANQQVPPLYQASQVLPYPIESPGVAMTGIGPVGFHDHNHFAMPPIYQPSLGTQCDPSDCGGDGDGGSAGGLWFSASPRVYYGGSQFASNPGHLYPPYTDITTSSPVAVALDRLSPVAIHRDPVAISSSPVVVEDYDDDEPGPSHLLDEHQNFGSENSFRSLDSRQPPEPHELSDKDDLSSCGGGDDDDDNDGTDGVPHGDCGSALNTPLDPFEKWPDAPRPKYEHIIETEVHRSALGKRFEYAYLKSTVCNCVPPNPDEVRLGKSACDESCFNRRIKVECNHKCPVYELCTNRRFQDRIYTPFEPFHSASEKGWGIRSTVPIFPGTFIIEYVGELIDFPEFLSRIRQKALYSHHFIMAIQKDLFIDAGNKGNWSRFVNHSCDPNTVIERWVVNGKTRIGFFAKKFIGARDEITIDYQFQQYGMIEQKCCCQAPNCTGVMGKVNEKLQEQIKSSQVRARRELIHKITGRARLRDISHVSDMITVIREEPPLERDTFHGLLTVLLNTESELCLRTFIECGGLKIITSHLDSVAPDDWALKLLYLQCLDHFKLKKRTLLSSGCIAIKVVEHWAQSARYSLVHGGGGTGVAPDQSTVAVTTMLLDDNGHGHGLEFPENLQLPPSSAGGDNVRFVLGDATDPPDTEPAERDIMELARNIKTYFDSEKEKFYIPKLKLLHSESLADLSLNDSESKSKDSASRASSVQGDYVKLKKQKIRRKCTEAIQKLSKDEFRRLFSERHEKSLAIDKNPITTNDSTPNVVASDSDSPDTFMAVKKLLSNVIIEEINRLKHSDKFLIMPAEFQNFDLDKILSDLNIVGRDGIISLMNPSNDENKTSSGSTYSNSSSKSLDDTSRSDLNGGSTAKKRLGLPPNWNSRRSESGRYYFYNTVTKKTQWDIPVFPWDAGEEDPMAYNFGNASQFPITRIDVQMMYEEYKKVYKQQKIDDRRRHRLERSIQRKLNLTAGEKNKIEFSKEVFRAVKLIVKPYNSSACRIGRIQHKQDLKFLCEKFADTIISKEVKLVANLEDLEINANVRSKIKTYIEKYMASQGKCFKRSNKTKSKSKPTMLEEPHCHQQSLEDQWTGTSHHTDSNNVPTVSDSVKTLNSPDFSP